MVVITAFWVYASFTVGVGVGLGVAVYLLSQTTVETDADAAIHAAERVIRDGRRRGVGSLQAAWPS